MWMSTYNGNNKHKNNHYHILSSSPHAQQSRPLVPLSRQGLRWRSETMLTCYPAAKRARVSSGKGFVDRTVLRSKA